MKCFFSSLQLVSEKFSKHFDHLFLYWISNGLEVARSSLMTSDAETASASMKFIVSSSSDIEFSLKSDLGPSILCSCSVMNIIFQGKVTICNILVQLHCRRL